MEKQIFSPSSTGEDKAILVQLMQVKSQKKKVELNTFKWYIIEQEKEEEESQNSKELKEEESVVIGSGGGKLRLLEFPKMPYAVPIIGNQCFALGSRIYVFGGVLVTHGLRSPKYADVYYLDLHCLHEGWKEGPYLNRPRAYSLAAVNNEKVVAYVTSTQYESNKKKRKTGELIRQPDLEVFDFHLDIWKPVPQPPDDGFDMLAFFDGGNKLLCSLKGSSSALCYDVKDGTWEVFDQYFGDFIGQSAVIGNTLFCHGALPGAKDINIDRALYAYDLVKREWFSEPVRGFEQKGMLPLEIQDISVEAHLFHINQDKLCLLWGHQYYTKYPILKFQFHVHCTKFRIAEDDKGYFAHVESYNEYVLDYGEDTCLMKANFLVM